MKNIFRIWLIAAVTLHAAFLDDDMDGVANEEDRCPNSAITDIVGADGCAVDKVVFKKEHHFDISLGYAYSRVDSNTSQDAQSLSLGYYYDDFSVYFYTSNYNLQTGEGGIDDTTLAFYYRHTFTDYVFKAGIGGYIPSNSGSGNKTDYFFTARATRYLDLYDLSAEYQHTFMQDDATTDSDRLTFSLGYIPTQNSYTSLSYTTQTSIYEGEEALQNISLYASYFLNSHWYISGELSRGLSDSAVDFSYNLQLGYYF